MGLNKEIIEEFDSPHKADCDIEPPPHICKCQIKSIQGLLQSQKAKIIQIGEGMKEKVSCNACGGKLGEPRGTGKIVFEYYCKDCGNHQTGVGINLGISNYQKKIEKA